MKFVGRSRALNQLTDTLTDEKSKLVVVYGRRRLGKSTLIKKILRGEDVYYEASEIEPFLQRLALASTIEIGYRNFDKPTFSDWDPLHGSFNNASKEPH